MARDGKLYKKSREPDVWCLGDPHVAFCKSLHGDGQGENAHDHHVQDQSQTDQI